MMKNNIYKQLAAMMVGLLFGTPLFAADCETAPEVPDLDTIVCDPKHYPNGISYLGSDGLILELNDVGITADAPIEVRVYTSTQANPASIVASEFGQINVTAMGKAGLSALNVDQGNALVRMDAGSIVATGSAVKGLSVSLRNNAAVSNRKAEVIFNGGVLSSQLSSGIFSLISGSAEGAIVTKMRGGTITAASGIAGRNLNPQAVAPIDVSVLGGAINATQSGISAHHYGTGAVKVKVDGSSTVVSASSLVRGKGIELGRESNLTSQADYNLTVSGGATVSGGNRGILSFTNANLETINISILDASTSVTGGIEDRDGEATLSIEGAVTGDIITGGGDDTIYLLSGSQINGAINMGADDDQLAIKTPNIANISQFDGGDGTADGLSFASGGTLAVSTDKLLNWETIDVTNNTTLQLSNENLAVDELTINQGVLDVQNTLSVLGDFTAGAGASVHLDVADAANRDNLFIHGNTRGTATVVVNNVGLPDVASITIPLIKILGQSNATFVLDGGAIDLPNVRYTLVKNANGGWDLVSEGESYTLGGSISGLAAGETITLADGHGQTQAFSNGVFSFTDPLPHGSSYAVTVVSEPTGKACAVSNGGSTGITAHVSNVTVSCIRSNSLNEVFDDGFEGLE